MALPSPPKIGTLGMWVKMIFGVSKDTGNHVAKLSPCVLGNADLVWHVGHDLLTPEDTGLMSLRI